MDQYDKREELKDLAARLDAIGRWQEDQVQGHTETGQLLTKSAKWLQMLSKNVCKMGVIGCHGGDQCDSDSHK